MLLMRPAHIILYFILIFTLACAYRRKTSKSLQLTRPVRPDIKTRTTKNNDLIEDEDVGGDVDGDAEYSGSNENTDAESDWYADRPVESNLIDDPDAEVDIVTGTPLDLLTFTYTEKWRPPTRPTTTTTTEPTTTVLMDLSVIGFNNTWCDYIKKTENRKHEGEEFVDLVKKLCSPENSHDNELRLSMRSALNNRKIIDNLMEDIVVRLTEKVEGRREKLLGPKLKISASIEFCYDRAVKSFKYVCFDPDQNPYMQRYLRIMANACRTQGLDLSTIREHIMDACESVNSNLVGVI